MYESKPGTLVHHGSARSFRVGLPGRYPAAMTHRKMGCTEHAKPKSLAGRTSLWEGFQTFLHPGGAKDVLGNKSSKDKEHRRQQKHQHIAKGLLGEMLVV